MLKVQSAVLKTWRALFVVAYLKRGGGVFLKFYVFTLVAGGFYKRS